MPIPIPMIGKIDSILKILVIRYKIVLGNNFGLQIF